MIIFVFIFAVIFTVIFACVLYPIAAAFYVIGKLGCFIGWVGEGAFKTANSAIKSLWSLNDTKAPENKKPADIVIDNQDAENMVNSQPENNTGGNNNV